MGPKGSPEDEEQWPPSRAGRNREAVQFYRERSKAPGVAEGGAERNHYCMSCNGVIPLQYDQREPASGPPEHCPHCGVELDERVRAMFNWVEIDQVPDSDLRALVGPALIVLALVAVGAVVAWAVL
jgi:hypothetical protein